MTGKPGRQALKAATRRRVLDAAAKAVRERGVAGVGVADVMREAGLTHGTFYAHFDSKEALMTEAIVHAADTYREGLRARALDGDDQGVAARLQRLAAAYLSPAHARDRGNGCVIAALAPEVSRDDGQVGEALAGRIEAVVSMIGELVDGASDAGRAGAGDTHRARAMASFSTAVGGLVLARAAKDDVAMEEILAACRAELAARRGARGANR